MSYQARRYKRNDEHHIPPRHPAVHTPIKKRVNKQDHIAYHRIFQNAGSFEQCVEILRWWWTINGKFVGQDYDKNQRSVHLVA